MFKNHKASCWTGGGVLMDSLIIYLPLLGLKLANCFNGSINNTDFNFIFIKKITNDGSKMSQP